MFFGIKSGKGWTGKKQLLITTEYSNTKTPDYPVVLKAVEVEPGKFKCTVKDWFRAYDTPEGSFTDHANLIMTRPRYAKAVAMKSDWRRFVEEIAAAGYATAPDYAKTIIKVGEMVERYL
jgi:flagellar protein FlgJ